MKYEIGEIDEFRGYKAAVLIYSFGQVAEERYYKNLEDACVDVAHKFYGVGEGIPYTPPNHQDVGDVRDVRDVGTE